MSFSPFNSLSLRKAGGMLGLLLLLVSFSPAAKGQLVLSGCVGECAPFYSGVYSKFLPGTDRFTISGTSQLCPAYTMTVNIRGAYNETITVASGSTFFRDFYLSFGQTIIVTMSYELTGSVLCKRLGNGYFFMQGGGGFKKAQEQESVGLPAEGTITPKQ